MKNGPRSMLEKAWTGLQSVGGSLASSQEEPERRGRAVRQLIAQVARHRRGRMQCGDGQPLIVDR